jgi:hypothetical protein
MRRFGVGCEVYGLGFEVEDAGITHDGRRDVLAVLTQRHLGEGSGFRV